jgi:hypothetical protein
MKNKITIDFTPILTTFDGIDGLKPRGTKINYTPEMISEWVKCHNDPLYFLDNYYWIVDLDKGLIPIELWDFQKDLINHIHNNRFSLVLASRQVGKSIITIGYILWYILFNNHKEIAVLSKTAAAASEIMGKLKRAYIQIPQWLAQNVVGWAGTSISLENGCHVSSQATTENAGRSASANILFLDEFAFVPPNIANKFYASAYPVISNSKTSKVIICSTPNGHNHFYVLYDKAKKHENSYKEFIIHWKQVPGRTEEWKKETIANLALEDGVDGEAKFAQEYDLEFENTNSKTLLSAAIQRKLANWISENSKIEFLNGISDAIEQIDIYELPNNNSDYFLAADVGNGIGQDYSSFSILKAENDIFKQVVTYNCNTINPIAFAEIIDRISKLYNNAFVLIENNGPGESVIDHLWYTLDFENLIHLEKNSLGIRTTPKSRNKGITKLKEYLEYGAIQINDFETLQQITHFSRNPKNGKFEAEAGYKDDLTITLILFSVFTTNQIFSSYLNNEEFYDNLHEKIKRELLDENPYLINYDNIYNVEQPITIVTAQDIINRNRNEDVNNNGFNRTFNNMDTFS